jgi:hypothetical protein
MMNYQEKNQTSQLHQNEPPAPPAPLMPPVLYRSIANELIYDDIILLQVQQLTGLPEIYRAIANKRIYDDDVTLHQLVQEADVSNNLLHRDDILELSQEMTYMGIEPP